MPTVQQQAKLFLSDLIENQNISTLKQRFNHKDASAIRVATGNDITALQQRLTLLPESAKHHLSSANSEQAITIYSKNIENFIGTVQVPVGLAGPLRINGLYANGDYLIPLATTEAALVASYNRGMKMISEAGGCRSVIINAYVSRCPCFAFRDLVEVGEFMLWLTQRIPDIKEIANDTTRHGKLIDVRYTIEGNRLYASFDYHTADASGQNMVTIATQAAFDWILQQAPVKPQAAFIEANMSGDKKASVLAFQNTRGRKVVVETVIAKELLAKRLHTSVEGLAYFSNVSTTGGILSGTIGIQGHYANALAALYIACGQDAACVSESAIGVTRFEKTAEGDLYASVTLPNIMVGTVGGGTQLPSQKACLDIMGLSGANQANALAEVAAALCLAGELSISAAMVSNTFTNAHQRLARG